jgi:hypothetical protein
VPLVGSNVAAVGNQTMAQEDMSTMAAVRKDGKHEHGQDDYDV